MQAERRSAKSKFINTPIKFLIGVILLLIPLTAWSGSPDLTLPFSQRYRLTCDFTCYSGHTGTDYATPNKTPLLAANNGKVHLHYSKGPGNYGYWIEVDHGNGFTTRYAHLDSYSIDEGESVGRGVQIALSGNSGGPWHQGNGIWRSPYHLHFEVRHNGVAGDPYAKHWWSTDPPSLPSEYNEPQTLHFEGLKPQNTQTNKKLIPTLNAHKVRNPDGTEAYDISPRITKLAVTDLNYSLVDGLWVETKKKDKNVPFYAGWHTDEKSLKNQEVMSLSKYIGHYGEISDMASGRFLGGPEKYLAVLYKGQTRIYFYKTNPPMFLGYLDPYSGIWRPSRKMHLTTGDVDKDGRDELLVSHPRYDHIRMFDDFHYSSKGWTMRWIPEELDAHYGQIPLITDIACMDIDSNGYDELLIATASDDHVFEYYYTKQGRKIRFVKQGYIDGIEKYNPQTKAMTVMKFNGLGGMRDYLAVITQGASSRYIFFYWERNLNQAWGGLFSRKGILKSPNREILEDLTAGNFDGYLGEELALGTKYNDLVYFYGTWDLWKEGAWGGKVLGTQDVNLYNAKLTAQSDKKILLLPNQEKELWAEYQNQGATTWFTNDYRTPNLITDKPFQRNSLFKSNSWIADYKPATLANQVKPSQKARYSFKIKAPDQSGKYKETFALYNQEDNDLYKNSKVSFEIIVDGVPPSRPKNLSPSTKDSLWVGNATSDTTPTFRWEKSEDELTEVTSYIITLGNKTYTIKEAKASTPKFDCPKLSEGQHIIKVQAEDKLGNLSDPASYTFVVDTSNPEPPSDLEPETRDSQWYTNITSDTTPTFRWQGGSDKYSGLDGYNVQIDSNIQCPISNIQSWTVPTELSEGEHTIYLASRDKLGHKSDSISYSFIVDISSPEGSVTINKEPEGSTPQFTNSQDVALAIEASDVSPIVEYSVSNDNVSWMSYQLTSNNSQLSTNLSWILTEGDGTKTVYIKFKDIFSQESQAFSDSIIFDQTNPSSYINDLPAFHNTLSFLVSWFGLDNLSSIKWFDVQIKDSLTNVWRNWLTKTTLISKIFQGIDGVTYWFRSRAQDEAGNQEEYPLDADTETKVDTTAPDPPTIDRPERNAILNASFDANPDIAGVQVEVAGRAEANSSIGLTNVAGAHIDIYSTQTDPDGNWSIENVRLYEGQNNLEAKSTDAAGNWNTSGDYIVWLDTIAPDAISDLSCIDKTYHSLTFSWTAPGDDENVGTAKEYDIRYSTLEIREGNFESDTKVASPPVPEKAGNIQTFTLDNLEPKQIYYLAIKTKDDGENWSGISNIAFDTTTTSADRVEVTSTDPSDNILVADGVSTLAITAVVYDPEGNSGQKLSGELMEAEISDTNGEADTGSLGVVQDNGNGIYTLVYTAGTKVGDGQVTVRIWDSQTEREMAKKEAFLNITLIPGNPTGTVTLSASPSQINADGSSTSTIISSTIQDANGNTVADGQMITVSTSLGSITSSDQDAGTPGIQRSTSSGTIQLVLKSQVWNGYGGATTSVQTSAQSVLGSASGSCQVIFKDVTAPNAPFISSIVTITGSDNYTYDNTPTIKGTAEKLSTVLIYDNGSYLGSTSANNSGNFSYTCSTRSNGSHTFKAKAKDKAGNTSGYSNTSTIVIDTVAPAKPSITSPANNSFTNDTTPTISGKAEKNSRVLIYKKYGGGSWGYHYYTYANSSGNFSYTFGSALANGSWYFKVKARDKANNTSSYSDQIKVTIDTVKPTIYSQTPASGTTLYHRTVTISANYSDSGSGINTSTAKMKIKVDSGSWQDVTSSCTKTSSKISYTKKWAQENHTYTVYVEVKDKAGNIQSATWSFKIQLVSRYKSKIDSHHKVYQVCDWYYPDQGEVTSPSGWKSLNFNDSGWKKPTHPSGHPIGCGWIPGAEWLWVDSTTNKAETMLLRFTFNLPNVPGLNIKAAVIRIAIDDAGWAYVSGNVNEKIFAQQTIGQNPAFYDITKLGGQTTLKPGKNVIAFQVSNHKDDTNNAGLGYEMKVVYEDGP